MQRFLWAFFASIAIISIIIGFFIYEPLDAGMRFSKVAYWNIVVCFGWFCFQTISSYGKDIYRWSQSRPNQIAIAIAIVAAVFLYTREGGGFKITFDEHTISNVAKSLHLDRDAVLRGSALPGIDRSSNVDKRPVLFPFLVATAHDIFGFSVSNAFYINGTLTAIFLLLLYLCTSHLFDSRAGWISIALACSTPIISQNSSGASLDMTNLVGIFACMLLAIRYSEKPESLDRFSCLILGVSLFSHSRYESSFLLVPVLIVIAINWIRLRRMQISWSAVTAPLFFIPIAWQHVYVNSRPDFKELKNDSHAFFSLDYMSNNLGHAANFFFVPDRFAATAPLVSIIGIVSLVILVALVATRGRKWAAGNRTLLVGYVFGFSLLAQFLLILGFSYGQLDNPIVTRLGMPFIALTILCSGIALSLFIGIKPKARFAVYLLIGTCFLLAIPKYSNHLYTSNNMILKRIDWIIDRHEELPEGNYLYIGYLSQEFELRGIGNMRIKRAISNLGSLAMHQTLNTFDDIFVIQSLGLAFNDGASKTFLLPGNDLGPWFELETIDEVSMLPMNLTRLSRIKNIHSSIEGLENEEELREMLLTTKVELINEIGQESYDVWLKSLP